MRNGWGFAAESELTEARAGLDLIHHAEASIRAIQQSAANLDFNGNDAVVLTAADGSTVLDCIGQVGNDPVTGWGTPPVSI